MSKLRYLVPPALLVAGTGGAIALPATNAFAVTYNNCLQSEKICLWYSAGPDSALWQSVEYGAYPNFSNDKSCNTRSEGYNDTFSTPKYGQGDEVRNDAHSMANYSAYYEAKDYLYVSPKFIGVEYTQNYNKGKPVVLPSDIINNEASYHDSLVTTKNCEKGHIP
jgi:hypothetical protein